MTAAFIAGLSGPTLTDRERDFFRASQPAGLILFRRNVPDHARIADLVGSVRDAVGRDDFLVLIDQEGGRVQRIKPPGAQELPPASAFADMYAEDPGRARQAAFIVARLAADELSAYGITMNCTPVLDVPVEGAHDIIGDRAYGRHPAQIIDLAREVAAGLLAGGVVPVIKHIPGHGRAMSDSHFELPLVSAVHDELSRSDFVPFKALAHLPAAMTAHVVFSDLDADNPASTSARVTRNIIRGEIGFDGLLMSDDLSMKALTGAMRARAEAVISAGSDLALHCNGDLTEMQQVAAGVPTLSGEAARRFAAACALTRQVHPYDRDVAIAVLAEMTGGATAIA
ncbi:MAG: beta-N-acetylhexosaminidase [Hyphomicrobium sp.]|nr:beta-N-acetylhexosaminidase [Hyphomicrobium sp.]